MSEDTTAAPTIEPSPSAPAPEAAPEPLLDIAEFARVQLRVAEITAAELVPKSKKLVKLQVSLGPTLGTRQVVAGIGQHYDPASLVGRRIVLVANLKPAKLMGIESQGMLLAASTEDGSTLKLVDPGVDMPAGSVVR